MGVLQTPALATWLRRQKRRHLLNYVLILPRLLDDVKSLEVECFWTACVFFALVAAFLMQRVKRPDEGNG